MVLAWVPQAAALRPIFHGCSGWSIAPEARRACVLVTLGLEPHGLTWAARSWRCLCVFVLCVCCTARPIQADTLWNPFGSVWSTSAIMNAVSKDAVPWTHMICLPPAKLLSALPGACLPVALLQGSVSALGKRWECEIACEKSATTDWLVAEYSLVSVALALCHTDFVPV